MKMYKLDKLKKLTEGMNLKKIARETGIKYMTLYWALRKAKANPRYSTIEKLSDYIENKLAE